MKLLTLFLLFLSPLFSLEIIVNSAKENNKNFEILHIKDENSFLCREIEKNREVLYECKITSPISFTEKIEKSSFFHIYFSNENNTTTIIVKPRFNSLLIPISFSLYEKDTISPPKKRALSTHWQIVGFKKKIEYLKKNEDIGINFPILYDKFETPFIGALDIEAKPITYDQKSEIKPYRILQKYFKEKEYEEVIKEANRLLEKEKNVIFKSEIILLKIRAMDKFLESEQYKKSDLKITYNDLEQTAKEWLKNFPSDQNIPEVLMFLSKAYLHNGMKKNALYYLNILTTEYKNSRFTELGKIYLIDTYAEAKPKKALKEYKKILFSTKDIFVASTAADRIANLYLKLKKIEKSKNYFKKILLSNPDFYLKSLDKAYDLAHQLAANSLEEIAAMIADEIIKRTKGKRKRDPFFEELQKNRAYWYDKAGKKNKAYKYYKEYLKKYPYGEYADFVKERLDLLIFDIPDKNSTKTLEQYDYILKKYAKDKEIKNRALLEKAKLLLTLKKYEEVLKMKSLLKDIKNKEKDKILKEAAYKRALETLKNKKCLKSTLLIKEYSLKIEKIYDKNLFECYLKIADYKNALKIFRKHKNEENLQKRMRWLYMGAKLFYKTGEYEKILEICKDFKKLEKITSTSINQMKYICFEALSKKDLYSQMISFAKEIEKQNPNNFKNIEIFYEIVKKALLKRDDLTIIKFAKKIMDIQNRFKVYTLSPKIEFIYIEALKRTDKNKEALSVLKEVLKILKDPKKRARALYLAGELSIKNKNIKEAKQFFQKCKELNTTSSWKELCKENLSLY